MKYQSSLFLLLLLTQLLSAQNTLSPDINQVVAVPQSPEAAAFEKYGNVPVSMYTGTPNISVPLFNLQGREMSIPGSLSYDASGIKVDQMATWVGLGWNLNVGGVVTRQVAGLPDGFPETKPGFEGQRIFDPLVTQFIEYARANDINPINNTTHPKKIFRLLDHFERSQKDLTVDLEPDIFSFNVNGLSGTIFINYAEDTAYCVEDPNIRVEFEFDPNEVIIKDQLNSWKITGPDGTQYFFNKKEITSHEFEHRVSPRNNITDIVHEYCSAWYISQIISPSKKDQILFNYSTNADWLNPQRILYGVNSRSNPLHSNSMIPVCGPNTGESNTESLENQYKIRQVTLQNITINGRQAVIFNPSNSDRKDLKGSTPLESIEVLNQLSNPTSSPIVNLANKIEFSYSYFGDPNDLTYTGSHSEERVRLKLDTVKMLGALNSDVQAQVYSFEYESPTLLPYRDNKGVDFWGYYNGVNNTDLIPSYDGGNGIVFSGADRDPSLDHTKIGTLTKIHYPTGGHSQFSYSLHSAPPTLNTYLEDEYEGLLNVTGGIDTNDPYNYCDDALTNTTTPAGDDAQFSVYASDISAKVILSLVGTEDPTLPKAQSVIIYKSGNGCLTDTSLLCNFNAPLSYCDLFTNNPPEIVYFGNPFGGASTYLEVTLPGPGGYRIQILNSDNSVAVDADLVRTVEKTEINPVTVGGLRVFKTVDRKEDSGTDEIIKYYYYGDYYGDFNNNQNWTNASPSFFSTAYSSSALVHTPLRFHSISRDYNCQGGNEGIGTYFCETLTRHSSNLLRSPGPHIAYSAVSEILYSPSEGYNGFSVINYYNEQETLSDIPFTKRKLANGESRKSRIYDKNGILLEETNNYFFVRSISGVASTRGLIKKSSESQTGVKTTEDIDNTGVTVNQYYQIWCENPDVWTPFPPPCGGSAVGVDTVWKNSFGINIAATFNLDLWIVDFNTPNSDFGRSQLCDGPCELGKDYDLIPVSTSPNNGLDVRCIKGTFPYYSLINYVHSSFWMRLDSTVTTRYENGNAITSSSYNYYDRESEGALGHYQLTRTASKNSDGTSYESRIYYPDDVDIDIVDNPYYASMSIFSSGEKDVIRLLNCANLHRIGTPILQESYVNGNRTFLQKNTFTDLGSSGIGGINDSHIVMLQKVKTSLGHENELKTVIEYHEYDAIGNPLEISRGQNGAPISFRWGYNNTYVIDRIDNATKAEVDAAGQGNDLRQDGTLGPQSMVNSYEYEPKFGRVSKITDPNGRATTFTYDGFGRLLQVIDHNGNLRSLTEYNLAPQP